jgi:selenocysteine-specific elongation factor
MQVIGTAGHVDHGKSTLVQRLTGIDPDRWDEEKRRGLTIDLGFAWLPLPSGREVGLIDVPGHERFIKNMLAGAGGMSVCLFVLAANEGWMPQSSEHLAIIDILGLSEGVVAVTKMDTVEPEAVDLVVEEARQRLALTSLAGASVIPCSAQTGEGLDEIVRALDDAVSSAPPAVDVGAPRLWIDRVFTIAGAGTVVTGTLAGGTFAVGDLVEIAPEGRRARIRGIQSHKKSFEAAGPGNRVALNLVGLDKQAAQRGDAVVASGRWHPTRLIEATVRVLPEEITGTNHKLTVKGAHLLYAGSAETPVKVKLLDAEAVLPGEKAFAQLRLRDALPLVKGDRFVLRDAGRVLTFGGGIVLDPLARPARGSRRERTALLERLAHARGKEALALLVENEGDIDADEALFRSGLSEPAGPDAGLLGDRIVSGSRLRELQDELRERLAQHHDAHPLERGMRKETLRTSIDLSPDAFDDLIDRADDVADLGPVLALASFSVELDPAQERVRMSLLERIESGGFTPPLEAELEADLSLLRSLVESGDLVKIDGFYLTAGRAAEARRRVREAIEERGGMTVAEIRDLLGTSRKYAVPLCEWLDATGATVRKGDARILGPNA